jgi:hypothetical protein
VHFHNGEEAAKRSMINKDWGQENYCPQSAYQKTQLHGTSWPGGDLCCEATIRLCSFQSSRRVVHSVVIPGRPLIKNPTLFVASRWELG